MASVCPVCSHQNPIGALICAECYAPLTGSAPVEPDTTQDRASVLGGRQNGGSPHRPIRHVDLLGPDSVALYIAGTEKPLNIQLTYEAILGRYSPSSIAQPRVDLAPYGAYAKGVSRLHAAIRRTQDNLLVVIDLDSTNGSWLNGTKLEPRRLYALRPGDRLLLGQIEVEVYFNP
jgi:hypothetical protein